MQMEEEDDEQDIANSQTTAGQGADENPDSDSMEDVQQKSKSVFLLMWAKLAAPLGRDHSYKIQTIPLSENHAIRYKMETLHIRYNIEIIPKR